MYTHGRKQNNYAHLLSQCLTTIKLLLCFVFFTRFPGGGGGGGGTLIFSHIRRLGPFFGFKILNFNIFGGFQKNE